MRKQKQPVPKTVKGEATGQQAFKDAVANSIRIRGFAKPAQVAMDLGLQTSEQRHTLAQTMGNMKKSGWLFRDDKGVYSLAPSYDIRRGRTEEERVVSVIRELGGLARAYEILDVSDARPAANKVKYSHGGRTSGATRRIYHILQHSKRIVRYSIPHRTMWGLPFHEMIVEPLTGRNADFMFKHGFLQNPKFRKGGGKKAEERLAELIQEHFEHVGTAFRRLREIYSDSVYDVAADPTVNECLEAVRIAKPTIADHAYAQIRAMVERQAKEKDRGNDLRYVEKLRAHESERVHAHLLALFEKGERMMHFAAPAELYRCVAARYGVLPGALSRGCILPCMIGDDENSPDDSDELAILEGKLPREESEETSGPPYVVGHKGRSG